MPIKSPFKRTLLNVQPIAEKKSSPTVNSLTEAAAPSPQSGFEKTSIGFSTVVTRQVAVTSDSADSIALSGKGPGDSALAASVSADPERPELVSLSSPFGMDPQALLETLDLRDFEASLDESDINYIYSRLTESELSKDIEKRASAVEGIRDTLDADNATLSEIVSKIEKFRRDSDFLLNSQAIHRGSLKSLKSLPRKYGEDVASVNPTFDRTFLNMEGAYDLSNTALVTLLAYTLLYPGSTRLQVVKSGNSGLDRFNVPIVKADPVNQLLTSISGIDVKTADGYLTAESLLPQDPIARIALISEALSYELGLSAGMKKLGVTDIITYIRQSIGATPNLVTSQPIPGSPVSSVRDGNNLLLETRDIVIDGVQYPGVLTALVDNAVASGTFEFSKLSLLTQLMGEKFGKLLKEILALRSLDDKDESISATGIVTRLADAVQSGTSSIQRYSKTKDNKSLSQLQLAQLLLLKELSNSSGSSEILESRFRTFIEIVSPNYDAVTVEDSSAMSEEKRVSSASTGTKVKSKITIDGETHTVEVENLSAEVKSNPLATDNGIKSSITAATTVSISGGGAPSGKSSVPQAVYSSETDKVITSSTSYEMSDSVRIHETFTGRGGSGHLSSTYNSDFDLTLGSAETHSTVTAKSDIFHRYGLTLGVAGLLGIGDAARRSLSGEDINLTLKGLLEIGVSTPLFTNVRGSSSASQQISTQMSVHNSSVVESSATQKSKAKLESTFGTIPLKYTKRSSNSQSPKRPRRSTYSITGLSTVLERKQTVTSSVGGQIMPTPTSTRQQDTVSMKRTRSRGQGSGLRSEDLYGLASDTRGIAEYTDTVSKISSSPSLSERSDRSNESPKPDSVVSKDDSDSVTDILSVSSSSKGGSVSTNPNLLTKQLIPESKQSDVSTEYKSFFALFPKTEGTSSLAFSIAMSKVNGSLKTDTSSENPLLSGTYRKFVADILESAGKIGGDPHAFDAMTLNYGISRDIIEFLCYSMFNSMCSCFSGIFGSGETQSGRKDFDILLTPHIDTLVSQQNLILAISGYTGSLAEFITRFEGYPTEITVFDSLRYAERVTETVKQRWSVMQSFISMYTSAVSGLTGLSSEKGVTDMVTRLRSRGDLRLLGDMTYETVTNSQLVSSGLRGPLKLDKRTRQCRTAKRVVPLFLNGYSSQAARNSSVACVGIPSRTLEFLRRKYQAGESVSLPTGKEYIEVVFTKQDILFPDLVLRSSTYRFCPRLSVVIQPTFEKNIQSAMVDFLYLCHNGTSWEKRGLSDALDFVVSSTGLDELSSYFLVVNHVIDALCNITNISMGSFDMGETRVSRERVISREAADTLLKTMKSTVGNLLPRGQMLPGNFLASDPDGYRFLRYSSLSPGIVNYTNESDHRLLGLVVTDPLFTAENLYTLRTCFTPFERTYCCVIDPDEFVIDKAQTLSTSAGKATFMLLVNQNALDVYPDVATFKEGTDAKILEGAVYASKVELVTA